MTQQGTLTHIGFYDIQQDVTTNIEQETSCTLTFVASHVKSAGQGRADINTPQRKGWRVSGEALLTIGNLITIYNAIESGQKPLLCVATPQFSLIGKAIFTKLSLTSAGNSVIRMTFTATGDGQPAIN